MILNALGTVLPLAVAVALSAVPVMATIGILLSPNHSRITIPFLIGSVLGLAIPVAILTFGALALSPPEGGFFDTVGGIALIVLGIAAIGFAAVYWRRGNAVEPVEPKWMGALTSVGPLASFGIAFGLGLRPKVLLIGAAVALALRGESLSPGQIAITLGFYILISLSTIAGPIIFRLSAPDRAETALRATREVIVRHGRLATSVILVLVGALILGDGLTRIHW